MRRVRFMLDERGPYEGMMCFGVIGDGEIEFIAIPAPRGSIALSRSITVMAEDDEPFDAPIKDIVTAESRFDAESQLASGYILFETV